MSLEVFDVACFGTSLTTSEVSREWQPQVQNRLQAGASRRVRMYSLGQSSTTSAWGLANVQRVINTRAKACLIEFAINDGFAGNSMSLATSLANTRAIVQAITDALPTMAVFLVTTNPVLDDRPDLASYYAQYATAASLEGVGLIDNFSGWPAANYTDMPDGVHPALPALLLHHVPNIVTALKPLVG